MYLDCLIEYSYDHIRQFLSESIEEQTALDVKTHQDQPKKGEKKEEKVYHLF